MTDGAAGIDDIQFIKKYGFCISVTTALLLSPLSWLPFPMTGLHRAGNDFIEQDSANPNVKNSCNKVFSFSGHEE